MRDLETEVGKFCWAIYHQIDKPWTLILCGDNGTGKTHCARQVVRWAKHLNVQYIPEPNVILNFSTRIGFRLWPELLDSFKEGGWWEVENLKECSILVLDELGGGHDPSGVGVEKLCQILSRREFAWNLITTNIMPESWAQSFDRRVASRLLRNSVVVDLADVPDFSCIENRQSWAI